MPTRYRYGKSQRLGGRGTFKTIREHGVRETRGPLAAAAVANDSPRSRLGISIGRPVGTAVKRNRIKRLLREAFRLVQHDFPRAYDLVITVRPHEPMILAEYQRLLTALMVRLHRKWEQRR